MFRGNQGSFGGAIDMTSSAPLVQDCLFVGNHTNATGGSVACRVNDDAVFRDCVFLSSTSPAAAAASAFSSRPTFEGCVFAGCVGAAVMRIRKDADVTITGCTFVANSGRDGTIVPRFETGHSPIVRLDHTIIAFNLIGPAIDLLGDGSTALLACCDLFGNAGGDWVARIAWQANTKGNFSADPLFCDPEAGDFTLQSDSPCGPPGVTGCGLVGALGVGCGPVSVMEESWARVKSRYLGDR
jgi:hypothetical protein